MLRKHWVLAPALGVALVVWPCFAQEPEKKTGSTISDKVDRAVQSIKKGAQGASDAISDQYHKARLAVHDMGVAGRIYGRLHWDKALTNSKFEIDVKQDGVATLTGTVPDQTAKTKAVDLARDTVGVTQVVDKLTISAAATTAPAATPKKP